MTNRTVQIIGYGFGATPATVTATANGTQVFSGAVDTVNEPPPNLPNPSIVDSGTVLFTFEIPMNFEGNLPMTVSVANSTVVFAQVYANYANVANVANVGGNVTTTFFSSGPSEFLNTYKPWPWPEPQIFECRSNVVLDGVAQSGSRPAGDNGTLWWTVQPGSTLSYDLMVTAGLE